MATPTSSVPFALVEADPEQAGNTAELKGELVIDGSCASIEDELGTQWLQIFDTDLEYSEAEGVITSVEGLPLGSGDRVASVGGEAFFDRDSDVLVQPWAEECDASNLWLSGGLFVEGS